MRGCSQVREEVCRIVIATKKIRDLNGVLNKVANQIHWSRVGMNQEFLLLMGFSHSGFWGAKPRNHSLPIFFNRKSTHENVYDCGTFLKFSDKNIFYHSGKLGNGILGFHKIYPFLDLHVPQKKKNVVNHFSLSPILSALLNYINTARFFLLTLSGWVEWEFEDR